MYLIWKQTQPGAIEATTETIKYTRLSCKEAKPTRILRDYREYCDLRMSGINIGFEGFYWERVGVYTAN